MANVKITDLPSLTGASSASTDVLPVVDVSTDTTSKMTREEFFLNVPAVNVAANSSTAAVTITQTGTGNALVVEDSTNPDSTPFVIDPVGNVGIGTSTGLTKKLNLASDTYDAATRMTNSANTLGFEVGLLAGTADATAYVYQRANSPMLFGTNNSTRVTIDASGNVGIGATPSTKLDVRGGSIVAGLSGMVLYGRLDAGFPSAAFNTGYFALGTNNTDAANGGMSIYTMAASTLSERMRITSGGNVGIGTTSPADKLQVEGNIYLGTSNRTIYSGGSASLNIQVNTGPLVFTRSNGATESMRIGSSGQIGLSGTNYGTTGQTIISAGSGAAPAWGTLPVAGGGTGAVTLTGYVKGSGTSAMTASATIPNTDVSGLGTMSTQAASAVAITGGTINGTTIGATTTASIKGSSLTSDTIITDGYIAHANGTLALAFGTDGVCKVTPTATGTFTSTVPPAGTRATLIVLTSGTTSYTMTFGTGFKTTGTLATGAVSARYFVFQFISDGTSLIEASRTVAIA